MRFGRKRLFQIKKKNLMIAAAALTAVIVIIGIILIISSSNVAAGKHASVDELASVGVINIGLRGDIGPLCTYDDATGTFMGLEKDVADELVKRLFGEGIIVNYVNVNSETKDALLLTGSLDISLGASISGTTSGINYSTPFYLEGSAFLVRNGEMTSETGLNGTTIAVVQGSPGAAKNNKNKDITNLESYLASQNINATVKVYASYPEAIEALRVKFVGGVCALETFLKIFGESGMLILPERFMPVGYCVEVRSSLGVFSDSVNDAINTMQEDGTLDLMIKNWGLVDYSTLGQ